MYEFPIYQWVVSLLMKLGMGIEVSSRLVTLVSFCSSAWIASLIIKEFCTQKTAYWFLLLYLVNPFGVIFNSGSLYIFEKNKRGMEYQK